MRKILINNGVKIDLMRGGKYCKKLGEYVFNNDVEINMGKNDNVERSIIKYLKKNNVDVKGVDELMGYNNIGGRIDLENLNIIGE